MSNSTALLINFIYYLEMTLKNTNKPYIVAIVYLMAASENLGSWLAASLPHETDFGKASEAV